MTRSAAWDYFTLVENNTKVKCSKCPASLTYKNSTTNMIGHLKSSHNIEIAKQPARGGKRKRFPQSAIAGVGEESNEDDPDDPDDGFEPQPKRPKTTPASQVQTLQSCVSNMNSFASGHRRDVECTNALAYMIVKDNLPLRTPEKAGFRKFVSTLQPLYKIPSEPTMTKFLEDKYKILKGKVQTLIDKAHNISLTMDLWTHKNTMRNYLGVTISLSRGSKFIKIELSCKVMDIRKTVENLVQVLDEVCKDWKIDVTKVRAAITDGGINIKNATKQFFEDQKHVNCTAHKVNTVGQKCIGNNADVPSVRTEPLPEVPEDEDDAGDDFDEVAEAAESSLREIITKVKKTVRFFKQSSIASASLLALQISEKGLTEATALKLIQEVRTRWNTCHDMIERYLELAPLVTRVVMELQRNKNSKSKPPEIITAHEEDILLEVKTLLAGLARATKELCAKNTSISMVIPLVKTLRLDIEKFQPITGVGFNLKEHLLQLIRDEFGRIEEVPIYAVATMLDPRFKAVGFYNDDAKPRRVANALTHVANLVKEKMRDREREAQEQQHPAQEDQNRTPAAENFWGEIDAEAERHTMTHAGQDTAGGMPIQLRMFMDRALMSRQAYSEPLLAWDVIKGEYLDVYAVAQEYLSILATSVDSERLFSHAGAIADQGRTRLSCKRLDMLVFMMSCDENLWF